jgi:energy-coupling factor transport system ATP-binding protein
MDPIIIENFYFKYKKDSRDIIHNANFKLKRGDNVLIFGLSGSGKSTLCYALSSLIPWSIKGWFKGRIKVLGHDTTEIKPNQLAGSIGLVMQNPDNQFINLTVYDELIFGAENLKKSESEIKEGLNIIVDLLDLKELLDRNVTQLSGGEKQRVILGSILMMEPELIILDEPLACLDAKGRLQLLNYLNNLKKINHDLTILIAEHRINEIIPHVNKYLLISQGQIQLSDNLNEINLKNMKKISKLISNIPNDKQLTKYNQERDFSYDLMFRDYNFQLSADNIADEILENKRSLIEFENISFQYVQDIGKKKRKINEIFNQINFNIYSGDKIGVIGPNGAGKTTLLYLIAGILEQNSGNIYFKNKNLKEISYGKYARNIGLVFQNPESQILKTSIDKEIKFGPKNFGVLDELSEEKMEKLISLIFSSEELQIIESSESDDLKKKNPFNLSWGQKRRLNLASLYSYNPDIYLFDEPFTGQDLNIRKKMMEMLLEFIEGEKAILISSHDEEILNSCNKIFLIENKKIQRYTKKL